MQQSEIRFQSKVNKTDAVITQVRGAVQSTSTPPGSASSRLRTRVFVLTIMPRTFSQLV
jgi:hypothetical protein